MDETIGFKLSAALKKQIKKYVKRVREEQGHTISMSEACRTLVEKGLAK